MSANESGAIAPPNTPARIVRYVLFAIGAAIVLYALSDHPFYGGGPNFGVAQAGIAVLGIVIGLCGLLPAEPARGAMLITMVTLAMLGFAETAGELVLASRYRPIYQYDDRLIFKFIPDRVSVMTRMPQNGGETVSHRINSAGFRGPELLENSEQSRVVVYGDSFIHASYTASEDTFAVQLDEVLTERLGRDIEVVNAGVSSYGPDQIALKMETELPQLRPDLAVVSIYAGNDYGDLMRNKLFRLAADGSLVENEWVLDPDLRIQFALSQQTSILKRAAGALVGSFRSARISALDALNMDFLLIEAEREYRDFIIDGNNTITNTHVDYYGANVSLTPNSASARYSIALMNQVLRRIRDVAARNNVSLAFLLIPHPSDVTEQYDEWHIDKSRHKEYTSRNQIGPLEELAHTLDVLCVSLYEEFRRRDANSLYFHGGDDHWNAAGQSLAAQLMADALLNEDMLDGAVPARAGVKKD